MTDNLQKFMYTVNQYLLDYYATQLPDHSTEFKTAACANKMIIAKPGKKYIKLVSKDSVFAFIETETGNIFKPASYAAPAKGIRGNINSVSFGAESLNFVPGTGLVHIKYAK